jgi:hypothetical protein
MSLLSFQVWIDTDTVLLRDLRPLVEYAGEFFHIKLFLVPFHMAYFLRLAAVDAFTSAYPNVFLVVFFFVFFFRVLGRGRPEHETGEVHRCAETANLMQVKRCCCSQVNLVPGSQ